jgi:transposase
MKKDLRSLSRAQLSLFRIETVKKVVKCGLSQKEVAKIQGIDESILSNWMQIYKKKWLRGVGIPVAKANPGGRPKDMTKNLTTHEMKKLEKVLLKEPRNMLQLDVDSSLWTANVVAECVRVMFGKTLKEGQIYKLLKELGFTNQKPIFRAYQQDLNKVKEWKDVERPRIEQEVALEGREILYGDEAGFKSTEHRWTTWWKKWITPIVKATWARFGINAASAVSKNGILRFMSYEGSFTSDTLIQFLDALIYKNKKPLTLILDGHPTHKTKTVQLWLSTHTITQADGTTLPHIRLYHIPPYSPELNPDEQVWLHTREEMKGTFSASASMLRSNLTKALYKIQKKKELISSFFRHPEFI